MKESLKRRQHQTSNMPQVDRCLHSSVLDALFSVEKRWLLRLSSAEIAQTKFRLEKTSQPEQSDEAAEIR